MIEKFKAKKEKEGWTYKWFYKTFLKDVSYPYFIIQLNDPSRMNDTVKSIIKNFMKGD